MALREKYSAKSLKMKVNSLFIFFFLAQSVFKARMTTLETTKRACACCVIKHMHDNFLRVSQNNHNSVPRNTPCNTQDDYIHMPTLIKR